jgi:hypothetical protein
MMGFAYDYLTSEQGGMKKPENMGWLLNKAWDKAGLSKGIMERMGLKDPFKGMGEDIEGLERVASRGLDPNEFGRRYGAQTGMAGRSITGQENAAVGGAALGLGENLLSGGLDKMQAEGAGARIGAYGDLLTRMRSEDFQISSDAKRQLMDLILAKQSMIQNLTIAEKQIKVQTGG